MVEVSALPRPNHPSKIAIAPLCSSPPIGCKQVASCWGNANALHTAAHTQEASGTSTARQKSLIQKYYGISSLGLFNGLLVLQSDAPLLQSSDPIAQR
ncbi:MAG: hypothetical protein V7L29_31275 [Nostoc sp.]|uniref:hypothetical protein n=1 Tax=Nostoc sp. TaxID=1180 RepID=UPI002FF61174